MNFTVMDIKGQKRDTLNLDLKVDGKLQDIGNNFLYLLDNYQKDYKRKSCASTKSRGEVRGGGAKPYKQKGTGRARRGTNRTPLRPGGSVIFGPKPHKRNSKLNNKKIIKALLWGLFRCTDKISVLRVDTNDSLTTSQAVVFLKTIKRQNPEKVLLIVSPIEEAEENTRKAFRNIENLSIQSVNFTTITKLVYSKHILITLNAFKDLSNRLKNGI